MNKTFKNFDKFINRPGTALKRKDNSTDSRK